MYSEACHGLCGRNQYLEVIREHSFFQSFPLPTLSFLQSHHPVEMVSELISPEAIVHSQPKEHPLEFTCLPVVFVGRPSSLHRGLT